MKNYIKTLLKILIHIYHSVIFCGGVFCLCKYWESELIVDKVHYGVFMLAFLILILDNARGDNNGGLTTS